MPISIAIGGDPLYTWCATAPLPHGIYELFLYGFVRKKRAQLVKSITNDLYVPYDADIVIEGFADPSELFPEGEFGDHTGYYYPQRGLPRVRGYGDNAKEKNLFFWRPLWANRR